jgi:uncharacterized protein RhaS with RHS repeats
MTTTCATYAYDEKSSHADHLDTPRLIADDTQKTVWRWEQLEPFGVNAANEDPDADTVAFEFNLRLEVARAQIASAVKASWGEILVLESESQEHMLSLDKIAFRRKRAADAQIEAEVSFTPHLPRP